MVNDIILKYLSDNKRLVIPDFGAFLRKDVSGEIVFVEFLKKDDGVLASLLQKMYALSQREAQAVVEDYVSKAKQSINTTGRFVIPGMGYIEVNANQGYELVCDPNVRVETSPASTIPTSVYSNPSEEQKGKNSVLTTPKVATAKPAVSAENKIQADARTKNVSQAEHRSSPILNREGAPQAGIRQKEPKIEAVRPSERVNPGRQETVVPRKTNDRPERMPDMQRKKKRADMIMIIAIIAAIIAISSMIYGIFVNSPEINLLPTATEPETEIAPVTQPAE